MFLTMHYLLYYLTYLSSFEITASVSMTVYIMLAVFNVRCEKRMEVINELRRVLFYAEEGEWLPTLQHLVLIRMKNEYM